MGIRVAERGVGDDIRSVSGNGLSLHNILSDPDVSRAKIWRKLNACKVRRFSFW